MLFDCCFQRRQWFAALALLCVAAGTCHTHAAKDGRLSVDLAPSSPPVRANAPLQVLLKVYWNDDTIVEGNFEATLLADGQTRVAECTSGDLVLTPGGQLIRLTMPTTGSNVSFGQDQIGLKFVTAEKVIDLQPILLPGRSGTRRFSICLITPNAATASDVEAEFRTSMRLGSILQGVTDTSRAPTSTVYWERDDVPEQSILFCSFDVVVLSPQGFSALRQRQLQALRQWVRAGGSVCVMLPSSLESHQSEFLNDLVMPSIIIGKRIRHRLDDS